MSESIAEMVVPGTYIEVRAEGLIGVGSIATGNIGIVGTAARGPRNTVVPLGSYAEALDRFGAYDPFDAPTLSGNPLTLVRALEQAFAGGARNVFAVRIANGDPATATATVKAAGNTDAFVMNAVDPGSWGNSITYSVIDEGPQGSPSWKLTLGYRNIKETYVGGTIGAIHAQLGGSRLVRADALLGGAGAAQFAPVDPAVRLAGGDDKANATAVNLGEGLAVLEDQTVNILLVSGMGSATARGAVASHLDRTETEGRERIAILGASASTDTTVGNEADALNDDRIVLVAPGILTTDAASARTVALPPPYLAAVIAGKLSTLAPQVSLTNKDVPVDDLDVNYNSTTFKRLLEKRVLVVRKKFGFQVVKGITTENAAFKQISVRRIVDCAKAGVRSGADPYIGRLNNVRVRAALKATLDGFFSQMILDEMLVGYELEVTASRAQEIQGIAMVTMTLKPTFSIDFIRVTMNLQ
jgi:hypothetical protein